MKKIGFFDSGIGGISVLRDAVRLMPEENYIYYGDTANAPYGGRSKKEIHDLTMEGVNYLLSQDIKALVIACNTATSVTVCDIRKDLSIPVISMEPAIKPALENVSGKVLVMATPATLAQERYIRLAEALDSQHRVINCPCEHLAGLIEKNLYDNPSVIADYLRQLLAPYAGKAEAVVLGCTHYIFVKDAIAGIMKGARLFDGNAGTVAHLKDVLTAQGIKEPGGRKGTIILNSSSDDQYTLKMYSRLLSAEH